MAAHLIHQRLVWVLLCTFCAILVVAGEASDTLDGIVLADTNHIVLIPDAAMIESGFGTTQSTTTTSAKQVLTTLAVISTEDASNVLSSVAAAYRTVNPAFSLQVTTASSGELVKSGFLNDGLYDFAITTTVPTITDYRTRPSLEFFPFVAMGLTAVYNLPAVLSNGFDLRMTGLMLCQIHRGNISLWTDPAIKALNPHFNWTHIDPTQLIEVITLNTPSSNHATFSSYCGKIDPDFAAIIPPSSQPNYQPTYPTMQSSLSLADDLVDDHPFTLTITSIPSANSVPLDKVTLVTAGGLNDLAGSEEEVDLAVIELSSTSPSVSVDLTNPINPQAWPMSTFQYLYLDSVKTRTTCAKKRVLLEFILWMYTNDIPRSLFSDASVLPIPSLIISHFKILESLRGDILCDNAALVSANAATLFVSADPTSDDLMRIYSKFYSGVDSDFSYTTRTLTESLSLERLQANEAAFILVRTSLLSNADLNLINLYDFVSLPAFMTAVVPIFTLPDEILAMTQNTTGQLFYNLPTLYPLVLDLDTMTRIFLGNVTSWLDGGLVLLNPQLTSWFQSTNANTTLTVIVGSSSPNDWSANAKVLFNTMSSSTVSQQPRYRHIFGSATEVISNDAIWKKSVNPFGLLLDPTITTDRPTNIRILNYETRLSVKSRVTPGSVSYRIIGTQGIGVSDETVEFRMVQTNSDGQRETVTATDSALKACNTPHIGDAAIDSGAAVATGTVGSNSLLSIETHRHWINGESPPAQCWPVFAIISLILPMQYTSNKSGTDSTLGLTSSISDTCTIARHGLEYANYIQSTSALSLPAEQLGLIRLASSSIISDLSRSVLYAATCDGVPVLVTTPSYFSISGGISQFGYAIGALGLLVTAVSLGLVIVFRHRIIIRSSSVPFLVLILCGIGLLFLALITWSIGPVPTAASCGAFVWLSQIGFMMVYIPLFAKTYRVWRIFSGSHLKVIKIGNRKLLAMSLLAIIIDLIFLAIWQGVSPLQPIEYTRQLSDHWDYYTHCSVQKEGLPFVIIEAVYKAGILLFGALMAFSTRNVKATFNESTQIAWSIYNTLLAAIIVAIMITFLNAIQSTLIIMVQILLLWMPICTWALLFIPKFQLLLGKSENEVLEASRSELIPQEKSNGFSFASVAFMNSQQLKLYYDALKIQVTKVQQRLGVMVTKFEPLPGSTNKQDNPVSGNLSGNHSRHDSKNSKNSLLGEASINKSGLNMNNSHMPSFAHTTLPTSPSTVTSSHSAATSLGKVKSLEKSNSHSNFNTAMKGATNQVPRSSMRVSQDSPTLAMTRAGNYVYPHNGGEPTTNTSVTGATSPDSVTMTGVTLGGHLRSESTQPGNSGAGGARSSTPSGGHRTVTTTYPALHIKARISNHRSLDNSVNQPPTTPQVESVTNSPNKPPSAIQTAATVKEFNLDATHAAGLTEIHIPGSTAPPILNTTIVDQGQNVDQVAPPSNDTSVSDSVPHTITTPTDSDH